MIELFPHPYNHFTCPACKSENLSPEKIIFQGIHLLADITCPACGFGFYQDFPTGHGLTYPVTIDKKEMRILSPIGLDWFTQPLLYSLQQPSIADIGIAKTSTNPVNAGEKVIFFNCLDAWYGHVLLKLLNIQFYHEQHPHLKKIVLLPAGFSWMVPAYADEIWTANIKLSETKHYFQQLDTFVTTELKKFTVVYYSSGYSHPPLENIRVQDFFGHPPFDPYGFESSPKTITFIYREDRLWLSPFFSKAFNFLYHRKHIKSVKKFFIRLQNRKINRFIKEVKKIGGHVEFYICGLGATGHLNDGAIDKRATVISTSQELEWCSIYAKSHVVVGIHGSNMLIPSALSAAWIEILPDDRLENITQDLFCKYSFSDMAFFGRFVSEYDPVKRVVSTIKRMFADYPAFRKHQTHSYDINK